jgi:hypothetical protein
LDKNYILDKKKGRHRELTGDGLREPYKKILEDRPIYKADPPGGEFIDKY